MTDTTIEIRNVQPPVQTTVQFMPKGDLSLHPVWLQFLDRSTEREYQEFIAVVDRTRELITAAAIFIITVIATILLDVHLFKFGLAVLLIVLMRFLPAILLVYITWAAPKFLLKYATPLKVLCVALIIISFPVLDIINVSSFDSPADDSANVLALQAGLPSWWPFLWSSVAGVACSLGLITAWWYGVLVLWLGYALWAGCVLSQLSRDLAAAIILPLLITALLSYYVWYVEESNRKKLRSLVSLQRKLFSVVRHSIPDLVRMESTQRLQALIQQAGFVLAEADSEGVFQYVSPGSKKLYGAHPTDLIATEVYKSVVSEDAVAVRTAWRKLHAGAMGQSGPGTAQFARIRFRRRVETPTGARNTLPVEQWVHVIPRRGQDPAFLIMERDTTLASVEPPPVLAPAPTPAVTAGPVADLYSAKRECIEFAFLAILGEVSTSAGRVFDLPISAWIQDAWAHSMGHFQQFAWIPGLRMSGSTLQIASVDQFMQCFGADMRNSSLWKHGDVTSTFTAAVTVPVEQVDFLRIGQAGFLFYAGACTSLSKLPADVIQTQLGTLRFQISTGNYKQELGSDSAPPDTTAMLRFAIKLPNAPQVNLLDSLTRELAYDIFTPRSPLHPFLRDTSARFAPYLLRRQALNFAQFGLPLLAEFLRPYGGKCFVRLDEEQANVELVAILPIPDGSVVPSLGATCPASTAPQAPLAQGTWESTQTKSADGAVQPSAPSPARPHGTGVATGPAAAAGAGASAANGTGVAAGAGADRRAPSPAAAPAPAAAAAAAAGTGISAELAGKRVLFVDDERANRNLGSRMLQRLGCAGIVRADGDEVPDVLAAEPVDVIVIDVLMQRLNGDVLCKQLRREGVDIPIIAMTANTGQQDVQRFIAAGFDMLLAKPFDITGLGRAIAQAPKLRARARGAAQGTGVTDGRGA